MAKSIRLDNDAIHDELTKLLLEVQANKQQKMKMQDLIYELIKSYKKKH